MRGPACPVDHDWVGARAPMEPLCRLMETRICLTWTLTSKQRAPRGWEVR